MRRTFAIVVVNVAILVVGLIGIELAFGGWLRRDELFRLGPLRGIVFHADASRLYDTPEPRITYSRDQYGFRGKYGDRPETIEMLTVGGSTTDQRYIADGQTWQDRLRDRFAADGHPLVVVNAGLDGESTVGHLAAFDWWLPNVPGLKPRYVLYYLGINDFFVRDRSDRRADAFEPLLSRLREKSAIYSLSRTLRGLYLAKFAFGIAHTRVDFATQRWTVTGLQRDYEFMAPDLDGYRVRLGTLIERTRRFGSQPIFMTQPTRYCRTTAHGSEGRADIDDYAGHEINGVDICRMMRRMDAVVADVSRRTGAYFIDMSAHSAWEDGDFYDFQHMTPKGIAKLADYMFVDLVPIVVASADGDGRASLR